MNGYQQHPYPSQQPPMRFPGKPQQQGPGSGQYPPQSGQAQQRGGYPPPPSNQPGISGQTISQAGGPTPTLNQLLQSSGGGGAGGAQPMPSGQHMYPPTGGYDHGYAPHSKGDYGGHWAPGPPPPSNGPPVNSYGHPPSSQHMLSQQQQSMYRQGAPPGPGRGPPGPPPPPSGPGQYYSPHHAGGGPPPPGQHQQFPPPAPQSPHYPPPPSQPPHAQQQQQRPYPPNLPPPRPGENQAHYPPGPPPPSNQQPPSHYPPGGVGSESPGLPPPSNSSSSGEGQPPKSTPPPPPSPSLVQQQHHHQMNHQSGGPNPPSPSASRSSAQPQLPPPQGTNNSSSPSHRPQGSSPSNSNSNSNAYPESGECNSNDSGGAQGARPSPSPTPRSMSPAVGGYPGQSMAPPQHHAMYPGGKLSHLPQMQPHYQQGPQQQHWQQQQQQVYPTGASRHHGGYPPQPPGQQPGPNNYPHPLPPQTRPNLPNHVAGTPPPPQNQYPYGPPPPGYGPGGPPPQQGQNWPPPQAQPQNQSQNPQQRSHPHYLKHHLQQKMGFGSPPHGGGYGGQMGPPSASGLPSSSPTPPLGSSGPHHLPPPPHEAESAESNANPPNIVSVGPDGAPVDEASQQSTLSNASGTSGGDEGPQMPKLRKEGPVSHTYQSHPPTPQGNAVHSPGAVSMGSIHEEYGEMNSPGWPKTPASPVLNSHPQPPPPSDHYRSKVKKPDSMNKLYDMDDNPERRMFLDKLLHYMEEHGTPITACPTISKNPLDLFRLYFLVKERGGFLEVTKNKTWKDIAGSLGIGASSSAAYTLRKHYTKHLLPFECKFDRGGIDPQPLINQVEATSKKKGSKAAPVPSPGSSNSQDSFPGPAAANNSSMDGFGGPSYPPYPPGGPGDYGQSAPPGGPPPSAPPGSQRGPPPPGQSPQNQSTHPGDKNISVSNPFDDMHPSNQYLHQFHPSHNQQQQGGRANYYPPYSTPPPTGYQGPPGSYPQYPPPPGQEYSRGPPVGAPPAGHEPYPAGQPYPQSTQGPYPPGPRPMYGGYPGETPPPGVPPAAPSAYPPAHPPPPQGPQGASAAPAPAVPPPPPSEDGRYNAMGPPTSTTAGGPPPPGQSPYPPQGRPPFPPQAPNGYPNQDYYHSQPPPPTDQGYPPGSGQSSGPGSHGSGGKHMPPPHPSQGRRVDYPPPKEGQAAGQPPSGAPYSGFLPPAGKEPAGPAGATTFPGYPPQGQGPPQQQRMPPYGWQNSGGQYPPSGPPQPSAGPPTAQPGRGGAYPGPSPTPGGAVVPSPGPPHPHPQAATSSAPSSHSPGAPPSSSPSQAPPQPWGQMPPSSRGPQLGQPAPPSGQGSWPSPDGRYGPGSPVPSAPPVPQVSPAGSSWAQPRPPRPGFPPPPGKGADMYKNFSTVGGMIPPPPPVSVGGSPGKPMMSGPLAHMNELSTMRAGGMGPPPHPLPPMSPQPQQAQYSSSSGPAKKEVAFPHDSIEAVTPLLTRRHKLHKNNVAPVEAWRIMMCLKSGLLAETTWALDVLNVLLYDDQSVSYFSLTYLPGLMEILLEHLRRSLILIFGQAVGIDQGDLKAEEGLNSKDRKWFETTLASAEEGVDIGVPNGVDMKEGGRTLVLSGTNYTFVSRISGDKVGILNREEEPFIVSGPREWDSDEKARNDPDFVGQPTATMDLTRHVITSFSSDLNIVPTIRILKDEKKENKEEEEPPVVVKEEPVDIEEMKEIPLPVPSHRFPLRRNSQVLNLPPKRTRRTRSVTDNNNEDEAKKQKKKEELVNGQSDDAMSFTGENSNSSHDFPEKKPVEILLCEGGIRVKDPGCSLKRRKMEEFEDECYTRDEPSLYHVTESQDSLARRCLSICNILRNLTFVPGNDVEFGKNMNFLSLMGKLLLLHHEHPLKGKPTSKRMKMMEEESSALNGAEDEDGLIAVAAAAAAAAEIDAESCTSLCGADEEWWWEYMHHIREHVLVMISNISGQMDLSSFSEEVSRPVLDGLLHWAVCPAAYGQDSFPTLGPSSGSNLSPQRLAIESLCKLSVTQGNVDLLLATPPYSRIERLCQLLCRCLCRTEDQVIREFSVNLISYLSAADSGVARTIALQNPCISLLISFIEQAESNAMSIANNHGFSVLRDNPEAMGTSLDMLRRAAGSLLNLSKHPDNRGLFVQHEPRLLQLVMSQILEQKVAALVSQVLYQCSTPEGLLSNKSNYNNNDIFYTPALSRSRNPAPHPHSSPHHGQHGHPGGPNGPNNVSINVSSRLSSGKEPAPNFPFFNNQVGNKHSSVSTFIPSS